MANWSAFALTAVMSVGLVGCSGMATDSRLAPSELESIDSFTKLGIQYLQAGDTVSAKETLQRALNAKGNYAPALNGMALVFQAEQENELAEKYFREAISADSSAAMVHNNFGAFLYSQKRYSEACAELARATEDPFYPLRAQAFENLGRCYRLLGKDEPAEFVLRRALQLQQERPIAAIELADLLLTKGQMEEAAQLFDSYKQLVDSGRLSHSAKSLWVGVRVSRFKGSASRAATYALLLKNLYPESEEYKNYEESGR